MLEDEQIIAEYEALLEQSLKDLLKEKQRNNELFKIVTEMITLNGKLVKENKELHAAIKEVQEECH